MPNEKPVTRDDVRKAWAVGKEYGVAWARRVIVDGNPDRERPCADQQCEHDRCAILRV